MTKLYIGINEITEIRRAISKIEFEVIPDDPNDFNFYPSFNAVNEQVCIIVENCSSLLQLLYEGIYNDDHQ